jgi:hypothetical protein
MRRTIFLFFLIAFLSFVKPIFASAPQIIVSPSGTVQLDQSFTITATMSGLSKNAIYRLRVAIAQPGTTDYFGSTYDGTTWHAGSVSSGNYVLVTTDANGSWFGSMQGKVDPDDPNFTTGSGTYDLKIGRYTQTGSTATWSDPVSISIYAPPPTPVPPTPTPTHTPTRMPTPTPTQKPSPIPVKTSIPTVKILPTSIGSRSADSSGSGMLAAILGTQSAHKSGSQTKVAGSVLQKPPVIFLLLGSIIVLAAGGLSGWIIYVGKNGRDIFYKVKS